MPDQIAVLPENATDALAAWDAGSTLRAFRVNTDGAPQEEIYAAAFEMIREGDLPGSARDYEGLTITEAQSAHSIAFVAMKNGWTKMVLDHIDPNNPEITIQKP